MIFYSYGLKAYNSFFEYFGDDLALTGNAAQSLAIRGFFSFHLVKKKWKQLSAKLGFSAQRTSPVSTGLRKLATVPANFARNIAARTLGVAA